jgi:hypothetical protein
MLSYPMSLLIWDIPLFVQVAFCVGACGVAGVLDLASARVTHVHHPRAHPASAVPQPVDGVRRRLGWMGLWGRGAAVVTVDARREAEAAVLALPAGPAQQAAAAGRAWADVSSLEPASVRYVTRRAHARCSWGPAESGSAVSDAWLSLIGHSRLALLGHSLS